MERPRKRTSDVPTCQTIGALPNPTTDMWSFCARLRVGDISDDPTGDFEYSIGTADDQTGASNPGQFDWGVDPNGNLNSGPTPITLDVSQADGANWWVGTANTLNTKDFPFNTVVKLVIKSTLENLSPNYLTSLTWTEMNVGWTLSGGGGRFTTPITGCDPSVSSSKVIAKYVEIDLPPNVIAFDFSACVQLKGPVPGTNGFPITPEDILGEIFVYLA